MFTDPPTRQSDPPRVRADLAIHLLGQHTAEAVTMARSVLIVLSCARIRISHPQPAYAALAVWSEALRQCPQVFDQTAPARITAPEATVAGHVAFTGPVSGVSVDALTAKASPSGAPQVRVRLGALLIIAADREAVVCQHVLWDTVYRHAVQLWPQLPAPAEVSSPSAPAAPATTIGPARPDVRTLAA